jgi:hypothetical protein
VRQYAGSISWKVLRKAQGEAWFAAVKWSEVQNMSRLATC